MGDYFDEPVILIKAAWGGHSLFKLFRSPSSGYPAEAELEKELKQARDQVTKTNEKNKKNDPLPTMEEIKKPCGSSYRDMMAEVKDVMNNPATMFPALKGRTPELAGFVWFQGWNDQYGAENEYESNLKHFINDVRKNLHAPKLPFVIAAMGQNGSKPAKGAMLTIQRAQLAMNDVPEFKGNVKAFRTDVLVDKAAEALYPTWEKNIEQWKLTGGDHGYHYLGSAIWFTRIGHAMGEAMRELLVSAGAFAAEPARVDKLATKLPKFEQPILFNTPEADTVLQSLEVFPPDNPWNTAVDDWPLAANSKAMIAAIGENKPLRCNPDMGFVLVPPGQNKVNVKLTAYSGESDPGPYPVPDNAVIEGWPADFKRGNASRRTLTLEDVQRGKPSLDADRHGIVVDPVNRMLYEFYRLTKTDSGWTAEQASIFNLASNKLRPEGWTSSDAAGLPIFHAIVRYDELQRGRISHALRATFKNTRHAYVYPATHFASRKTDPNLPRMGERFRLRKDFDTSKFSPEGKCILEGLKRYGMLNADNGIDWAISVAPDERIPVLHDELRKVKGSDFEVVTPPKDYLPPK